MNASTILVFITLFTGSAVAKPQGMKSIHDVAVMTERMYKSILALRDQYGRLCKCANNASGNGSGVQIRGLGDVFHAMNYYHIELKTLAKKETRRKLADEMNTIVCSLHNLAIGIRKLISKSASNSTVNPYHNVKAAKKATTSGSQNMDNMGYKLLSELAVANAAMRTILRPLAGTGNGTLPDDWLSGTNGKPVFTNQHNSNGTSLFKTTNLIQIVNGNQQHAGPKHKSSG